MAEEFWDERPEEEDLFLTPQSPLRESNQLLQSSAWITRSISKYTKLIERYFLVCANPTLRHAIVDRGPYDIPEYQARINFTRWEETSGMSFQPPGYEAWVQLFGAPLQLWNKEELEKLSVKLGTIKYVMPYGIETGQLEKMTLLIASKHPRRIPRFFKVHIGDYAKRVRVMLLGWRIAAPGYFPPPLPPNGTLPTIYYPPQPRYNYPNPGDQHATKESYECTGG